MVDARSARFQGLVPGNWGTSAPQPAPARRTSVRQTEPPAPPAPRPNFVETYLRSAPQIAMAQAEGNIFNPFPSVARAGAEGKLPESSELGTEAAFLGAGFLPMGKAASQLNAIVKKLNKSTDVGDFITAETMRTAGRPNRSTEGLYRPGARGFDHTNVPEAASPYTFGLVPTEKLSPLREFDRAAQPFGEVVQGPDNLRRIAEHLASGGKLSDPTAVAYTVSKYSDHGLGYLAEGNHRLALAEALGLEQLPVTIWRNTSSPPTRNGTMVGRRLGDIDPNQLSRDAFNNPYIPPEMHPFLLKYFQPGQ